MSRDSGQTAPDQHRGYAPKSVRCSVLTVSDSRTAADDKSGDLIQELLEAGGHEVAERSIVPDEPARVKPLVLAAIARPDVDAVLLTGGTGIAPRDSIVEAVEPLLERRLTASASYSARSPTRRSERPRCSLARWRVRRGAPRSS